MDTQPTARRCTVNDDHELHGARHASTACQPCEEWILDRLNEVEHLWLELPAHMERRRVQVGPRVTGNTPTGGPLPLSEEALALIGPGGVHDRLAKFLQDIQIGRLMLVPPVTGSADYRVATITRHLRRHLPWAAQYHHLEALGTELLLLCSELRYVTDSMPDRAPTTKVLPLDRCPQPTVDSTCGGALRYTLATGEIHCDNCGEPYQPRQADLISRALANARQSSPAA
jgi:hypothetical protein